jgi:hypothetical protein
LSDYEVAEEVRELAKCKHVFHRDCIDQVRYSCNIVSDSINLLTLLFTVVNHGPKLLSSLPWPGCQRDVE